MITKKAAAFFIVAILFFAPGCTGHPPATVPPSIPALTVTATDILLPSATLIPPTQTVQPSPTVTDTAAPTPSPTMTLTPWPEDIYPPALPLSGAGAWQGAAGCPNPKGLQAASDFDPQAMTALLTDLFSTDPLKAQIVSDPSLWPLHFHGSGETVTTQWIKHFGRASFAPFADLVKAQCGEDILQKSWWINLCAGPCGSGFVAIESHVFFILRNGHWLVWAVQ